MQRIQQIALRIWKNLGHGKTSGEELIAQLHKYYEQTSPYNSSYSPQNEKPLTWWKYIFDGRSSLSRLAKVIFSITPHSASCERLFSSLGWFVGKRRTNLDVQTIESMAKVYYHYLSHTDKSLNFTESLKENNIQQMLNSLFEDDDLSHEDDEEDDNDLSLIETEREAPPDKDEMLNIDEIIDLGPWVYIDNSIPPIITRRNDSDNEEWDPEELLR
jgi:hAT family C-terminal dimerisation region